MMGISDGETEATWS